MESVPYGQRLEAMTRERDAYRIAKQENDERFMNERDQARHERDQALRNLKGIELALGPGHHFAFDVLRWANLWHDNEDFKTELHLAVYKWREDKVKDQAEGDRTAEEHEKAFWARRQKA
jgi:hypothetical protein